ncbi:MAG TPA: UpxY family transcription antiterminator [Puia sp.]|jgi:transcription antitermination factor NusG|nr:UpxY family transcription antiterminator [Puia sp.]
MSESKKNWYVVYTKPRWEKKVFASLTDRHMEAYCPLNKVRRRWSDRIKWVEEPLFKSYVFVRVTEAEHTRVRMITGVVNFIYWLGKPAVVKNKEIEVIRKFLNDYEEVSSEPVDIQRDATVVIRQGAFMDKEARVVKVVNNKVRVLIESIGYALVAVVAKSNVEVIEKH